MSRTTQLSQKHCDHCRKLIGASRLIVHDPKGVSGVFCVVEKCFDAARKAAEGVSLSPSRLHADLETLVRVE